MIRLLNKLFDHRVIINCDHLPYLTRWFLFRCEAVGIMLHLFHRGDYDRELHDHPWNFISIILWRGYREFTEQGVKRRWPGMILYRAAEWRHRVELIKSKPAWTLVIRFKKRRDWGFWGRTGFVQWNQWWKNNCE